MLALTENATQAVEAIVAGQQLPDGGGLRVSAVAPPEDSASPDPDLRLSVVEGPEPGDEVVEGAPVYVEPSTAEIVSDKILDARVSEEQVQFMLREQESPPT